MGEKGGRGGRWERKEEREGGEEREWAERKEGGGGRKGRGERKGSRERRGRGGRVLKFSRLSLVANPSTREARPNEENTYIGQGTLMPPDSAFDCNRSRSYGVILIQHFIYDWNYVKIDSTFNHNDTDTMCREMGYTHYVRNTLITLSTARQIFGQTYNKVGE
jgi:hypothetical protein